VTAVVYAVGPMARMSILPNLGLPSMGSVPTVIHALVRRVRVVPAVSGCVPGAGLGRIHQHAELCAMPGFMRVLGLRCQRFAGQLFGVLRVMPLAFVRGTGSMLVMVKILRMLRFGRLFLMPAVFCVIIMLSVLFVPGLLAASWTRFGLVVHVMIVMVVVFRFFAHFTSPDFWFSSHWAENLVGFAFLPLMTGANPPR
jgi:hypothetical protein